LGLEKFARLVIGRNQQSSPTGSCVSHVVKERAFNMPISADGSSASKVYKLPNVAGLTLYFQVEIRDASDNLISTSNPIKIVTN
jgi:hypothetical protein